MNKLKALIIKYRSILIYLILGGLTTAVNYAVYVPLYNICGFSATFSNVIAWVAAVVFAFFTNKPLAFESKDWTFAVVAKEFLSFVLCRAASGAMETGLIFLLVDYLHYNGNVMKLLVSILVIIINYFGSKFFVFKK